MLKTIPVESLAAIILCGGKSSRIGFDKSQLVLGNGVTFLDQIVSSVAKVVKTVVVVSNSDQMLNERAGVLIAKDRHPERGPMEGIASGLAALPDFVDAAFVTSCDVPLLRAEIIPILLGQLDGHDGVTPVNGNRVYGLTAIYRKSILSTLNDLIQAKRLKVASLAEHVNVKSVPLDLLREVDPELQSLTNVNSLEDYRQLAKNLGFKIPKDIEIQLQ